MSKILIVNTGPTEFECQGQYPLTDKAASMPLRINGHRLHLNACLNTSWPPFITCLCLEHWRRRKL